MDTNTPATAEQLDAIRQTARERLLYIRWIAEKLLVTTDRLIRKEASDILMQLTEGTDGNE